MGGRCKPRNFNCESSVRSSHFGKINPLEHRVNCTTWESLNQWNVTPHQHFNSLTIQLNLLKKMFSNGKPIADEFASRILNLDASQGLVVGLIGSWGSGKTSFINLAKPKFKSKEVPVFEFNPWLFSGTDQLVYRFFSELSAELGEDSNLQKLAGYLKRYGDIVSPMAQSVSSLLTIPLLGLIVTFLIKVAGKKKSSSQLRNSMTEELRKRKKPIIVVLDDIDRLSGDEIRDLF